MAEAGRQVKTRQTGHEFLFGAGCFDEEKQIRTPVGPEAKTIQRPMGN